MKNPTTQRSLVQAIEAHADLRGVFEMLGRSGAAEGVSNLAIGVRPSTAGHGPRAVGRLRARALGINDEGPKQ